MNQRSASPFAPDALAAIELVSGPPALSLLLLLEEVSICSDLSLIRRRPFYAHSASA